MCNNVFVQQYVCAQSLESYAHSLKGALGSTPQRPLQIREVAKGEQARQVPPKILLCSPPNKFS